jgi:hypothetical protein
MRLTGRVWDSWSDIGLSRAMKLSERAATRIPAPAWAYPPLTSTISTEIVREAPPRWTVSWILPGTLTRSS